MRRQGGGFGFLMLLVVLAIVALVALRNAKSISPAAVEIQKHNEKRREVNPEAYAPDAAPTSASGDAWTPTPPARPGLGAMDQKTTEHTDAVQDALSQSN